MSLSEFAAAIRPNVSGSSTMGVKIYGLHQCGVFIELINAGVVTGFEAHQHIRIRLPRQPPQNRVERSGSKLCRASRRFGHRSQLDHIPHQGSLAKSSNIIERMPQICAVGHPSSFHSEI
jgi:hypothetical protein